MANLKIDGRMKVATLKEAFFNEFGGVLRIYDGNKRANDDALLCDIRVNDDVASGEYICRASRTVGKFCEEMMQVFGIKVKVATCDDWVLVLDGITLATIKKIPKQATIEMMKKFLAYQRKDNSSKKEEEDNVVVPAIHKDTNNSNKAGLAVVERDGKNGVVNIKGEVVIPIEYDDIRVYNKLCVVSVGKEGKYGLLDLEGKELYPLQYDKIDSYTFDNALTISGGGRTIVIGKGGQITKTLEYDEIVKQGAEDEYLLVRKDGLWGKLDMKCNEILPCEYNYYILYIQYKYDKLYVDAKEMLELEEVTEDSIRQFMEDNECDELYELGYEYFDNSIPHITSVESISLISNDKGPNNWVEALRECDEDESYDVEEFDVDEIEFEPAGYDVSKGIVMVGTMQSMSVNFELLIHEGEQFDPEQLRICAQEKCHADFDAIYKGTPLSGLGITPGYEDYDYPEYTCLYVDGECILEE